MGLRDIHPATEKTILCGDGYHLRYRVWVPDGTPRATIVLLNGIMSHSGWFEPLASFLVSTGIKLVGADRRGTGLNSESRGDAPSAKALVDDLKCIIDAERIDDAPLHLVGWCWGAVLAINLAAEYPSLLTSLVLLAPGLYPTNALKDRMNAQEEIRKSSPLESPCLESPIAETMFTAGPYLSNFIMKDTQRTSHFTPRFHSIMVKMGMGALVRLGQLDLPMLLVLADTDEATDNSQTLRAFDRIKAPVTLKSVCSAHGIQFDAPEELSRLLVSWVVS